MLPGGWDMFCGRRTTVADSAGGEMALLCAGHEFARTTIFTAPYIVSMEKVLSKSGDGQKVWVLTRTVSPNDSRPGLLYGSSGQDIGVGKLEFPG